MLRGVRIHFILYVSDQETSQRFYRRALGREPRLHVPGMTEFDIDGAVLGLMPESGIRRLLGPALPDPSTARMAPRAEVYLVVDDARPLHLRALEAGGREISPVLPRDWGHEAGYLLDPDGHVVAFAHEATRGARPDPKPS